MISDTDLSEKAFYSGRYAGYRDEELMEVIDTQFFQPDEEKFVQYSYLYQHREDIIHNGKLIHFRQLDQTLDLPDGTAKRLINQVAARYKLKPLLESDNMVRYCGRDHY
jgi:hypothetical protein